VITKPVAFKKMSVSHRFHFFGIIIGFEMGQIKVVFFLKMRKIINPGLKR